MLTPELMGVFALAILWTATLLIVAVAFGDLVALVRRSAVLAQRTFRAVIEAPQLAQVDIDEVGRAMPRAKRRTILFHPRRQSGRIEGGQIRIGDDVVAIPPLDAAASEVWPRRGAERGAFEAAYAEATRIKGTSRTSSTVYGAGDEVFVCGELRTAPDGAKSLAPIGDPTRAGEAPTIVVAAEDPRAWIRSRIRLSWLAIAGFVGSAAGVTALAFVEPGFGTLTQLAGVLGLAQFLIAQPLGVALRDAVSAPDRRPVHHEWIDATS